MHFEESSPNLSFNPLHTSYHMETDSDSSDSASIDSDTWGFVDNCNVQSLYQYSPHAYIAIVIGPAQQGTSSLPLLDVVAPSSIIMRAPSNPLDHSLHDQSSQVEVCADTYDQHL